jgi:hypothetical protein
VLVYVVACGSVSNIGSLPSLHACVLLRLSPYKIDKYVIRNLGGPFEEWVMQAKVGHPVLHRDTLQLLANMRTMYKAVCHTNQWSHGMAQGKALMVSHDSCIVTTAV